MSRLGHGILVTIFTIIFAASEQQAVADPGKGTSFTVNHRSQCVNGNKFFFSSRSAAEDARIRWSFGDGTASEARYPVKSYKKPGRYTVVMTTTINGVTAEDRQVVEVYQKPVTGFAVNSDDQELGKNTFEFLTTGLEEGYTYNWTFGDGSASTERDPVKVYNSAGSFEVQQLVIDPQGCTARASVKIQVKPGQINDRNALSHKITQH